MDTYLSGERRGREKYRWRRRQVGLEREGRRGRGQKLEVVVRYQVVIEFYQIEKCPSAL